MYTEINVEGKPVQMNEVDRGKGLRFEIEDRFNTFAVIKDPRPALDFFRNYVPLLTLAEIPKGWKCYKKASKQKRLPLAEVFWKEFDTV